MKLYLASYRIPTPDDLFGLINKKPADTKVALIPNAKDYYSDRARAFKINVKVRYLQSLGFSPDVIDLNHYKQEALNEKLQGYDLIWCNGGNSFCLREAMHKSGFDQIISGLLENGVVYGGDSAGACVAGPTLRGVETADEPEFSGEVIWDGLSITPKIIIPHADNESMKAELAPLLEMYKGSPDSVILNDNQAYIVDGDATKVVTGV